MEKYQNLSGDSTVRGYEIGEDSITVQFKDNSVYLYNSASASAEHIKNTKQLAALLPTYGIICKLEDYPDLEHIFPEDFESKLPEALNFLFPDR